MRKVVEARKDVCPIPIIKAKKGLRDLKEGDSLLVYVDNAVSAENLLKLAGQLGIAAEGGREKEAFTVEFFYHGETLDPRVMGGQKEHAPSQERNAPAAGAGARSIVVVGSETMGMGDDTLGRILMKGFLYALTGLEETPAAILFYNGGVKLTCEGSEALSDLKGLEGRGVSILSCGTCLDYYRLKEKLRVGRITNMYEIAELQQKADRIIRP